MLRHGKVVATCDPRQETAGSLAKMMVGTDVDKVTRNTERNDDADDGEVLLEAVRLDRPAATPFAVALKQVSLTVRAGTVVGIAGVAGNGQTELFEALSGEALSGEAGMVRISGHDAGHLGISDRRMLGAAFVPEERLGHATVPNLLLSHNLLLSRHATDGEQYLGPAGWLNRGPVRAAAAGVVSDMDVRAAGVDPQAAQLSGGNLQKFIVGRELDRQPKVLVINQPTWGVDANAAARIRQALVALAANGSAVLLISQDLDELQEVCDWLLVMHDGECSEPLDATKASAEQIGLLMGGAA